MPAPQNPGYDLPVWGEVGELLKATGSYLQGLPDADVRRFGSYLETVGNGIANSDTLADAAIDGLNGLYTPENAASEIAGLIAGIALAAWFGSMAGALALTLAASAVGLPAGVLAVGAIWLASEATEFAFDKLFDLLREFMADPLVLVVPA